VATALLVIDVQRSLLDEGPWGKAELLSNIRLLIDRARESDATVVFIQDTRVEPDGSIDSSLRQLPGDITIKKDYCDSFLGTRLHEDLQEDGITKLIVCGMQTDYCIDTTCRRAASFGF
jgi:nicotinamidase-related amidase